MNDFSARSTAFAKAQNLFALAAITLASPLHAQNPAPLDDNASQILAQSSPMRGVCLNQQIAVDYAGYMMGYNEFDTGGGERISIEKENALAQEIVGHAKITDWSFKSWSGNEINGRCSMHFSMQLAPEHATHFNNDSVWGGDVIVGIVNENGEWKIESFQDAGTTAALSGWLAVWRKERDRQPGGAPRLAARLSVARLSAAEIETKASKARACASHWEVANDLFPAYNSWLDAVNPDLKSLKVTSGGELENGRLVSSKDTEIVCRYDIGTGPAGGSQNRSIHNIDFRFTIVDGRPKWEVASFPYLPGSAWPKEQSERLVASIYIGDQTFKEWEASRAGASVSPQPRNVVEAMAQEQNQYARDANAHLRSQGIDVDAIKRAEAAETRKLAPACRRRGGTWGKPIDKHGNTGRLGCYFPTGER